jgi:hypothetical protein
MWQSAALAGALSFGLPVPAELGTATFAALAAAAAPSKKARRFSI